jgi:hypothetical protein
MILYALSRSFPRKRESRGHDSGPWVPAFAGTSGINQYARINLPT